MHRPKSYYKNMTQEKAEFARFLYFKGKLKQREIAGLLGIKQNSVSRIISGQVWT